MDHPSLTRQRRIPVASRWLAEMLDWQGHSKNDIARKVRCSESTIRRWLNGAAK